MSNYDGFIAQQRARGKAVTPELIKINDELKRKEAWKNRPLTCRLGLHYDRELLANSIEALLNRYTYCTKCYKGYLT